MIHKHPPFENLCTESLQAIPSPHFANDKQTVSLFINIDDLIKIETLGNVSQFSAKQNNHQENQAFQYFVTERHLYSTLVRLRKKANEQTMLLQYKNVITIKPSQFKCKISIQSPLSLSFRISNIPNSGMQERKM